jgi:hypothetical protein
VRRSDGGRMASSIAWDDVLCWSRMQHAASQTEPITADIDR